MTDARRYIHIQQKRHPTDHHSVTSKWKFYEFNFKTIISGAMITPVNMIPPPPTNLSFH